MNTTIDTLSAPLAVPVATAPALVPFVDVSIQNRRVATEIRARLDAIIETNAFVLGPAVAQFESEYAEFCQVDHCVGVGNGTDAIELALQSTGIGTGDEVIIPANTFVATAEAVVRSGATPILADCDSAYLIKPESVADALTSRTRAVIGVDLYGQVADFDALRQIVGEDILLFEDAAQSQGARRWGRPAGSFGVAAATSFYPGKNLGAYGDAGAVTTGSVEVADRIRALRNHGGVRRYEHHHVGTNSRLDSIQAAVLSVKLAELQSWNLERSSAADLYARLIGDHERIILPQVVNGNEHVWHLYVVRVPERDRVLESLAAAGIGTGVHYPAPIHRLPAFADVISGSAAFPMADRLAGEILSLPMFPGITPDQQQRVVDVLKEFLS